MRLVASLPATKQWGDEQECSSPIVHFAGENRQRVAANHYSKYFRPVMSHDCKSSCQRSKEMRLAASPRSIAKKLSFFYLF